MIPSDQGLEQRGEGWGNRQCDRRLCLGCPKWSGGRDGAGASVKRELPVLHEGGRKEKRETPGLGLPGPGTGQCSLHLKEGSEQGEMNRIGGSGFSGKKRTSMLLCLQSIR